MTKNPKWDDASSYEYMKKLNQYEFAWEFIRRDKDYIAEWDELMKNSEKYARNPLWEVFFESDFSPMGDYFFAPEGATATEPENINFIIYSKGAWKWQLKYYQNPQREKLHAKNHFRIPRQYISDTSAVIDYGDGQIEPHYPEDFIEVPIESYTLISRLDLLKPLKPQIEDLKTIADIYRKHIVNEKVFVRGGKKGKVTKNARISFLRLLDAKKAGVKRSIAAPQIFKNKGYCSVNAWNDAQKQIRKMVKNRYKELL